MSTTYPTDLTDAQWTLIEKLLPKTKSNAVTGGRPRKVDLRVIVNGILYLNRSGCQWRMLPRSFGPWPTVHDYYRKWRRDGTWQRIHDQLREKVRRKNGKKPTPSAGVLDSQSVKTAAPRKGARTATTPARRLQQRHALKSPAESVISSSIHSA